MYGLKPVPFTGPPKRSLDGAPGGSAFSWGGAGFRLPSGAEAHPSFLAFSARLKSCPDTKGDRELLQIHGSTERLAIFVLILCYE